ncbi:MAG: hypothetical protein AABW87_03620, partial [Nanoarchaeota archaeon]
TSCAGIDLCPGTPDSEADTVDEDGCSDEQATCSVQWDCSRVQWGPCTDGLRTRDVGDCSASGIQNGLCRCVVPGTESCSTGRSYVPPSEEACAGGEETEFPFFSSLNVIITLMLLAGFYLTRRNNF